jgi:pSer/pThr/pTyr-binding forkhead associated (FHA) protein
MGLARQTLVLQLHGRRVEFEKGRVVLGRGRQVDLQLEDPNVSRRHAVIYWENGRLFVKDLGSTNGTLLNGRPVKSGPLSRGDVISVGGNEIRVETG